MAFAHQGLETKPPFGVPPATNAQIAAAPAGKGAAGTGSPPGGGTSSVGPGNHRWCSRGAGGGSGDGGFARDARRAAAVNKRSQRQEPAAVSKR